MNREDKATLYAGATWLGLVSLSLIFCGIYLPFIKAVLVIFGCMGIATLIALVVGNTVYKK